MVGRSGHALFQLTASMRIAAIDIGTNTVQLLIADAADGHIRRICTEERFVRLGEGLDARGRIRPAAQERLLGALYAYREATDAHTVDTVAVAGTSALRDATNRQSVLDTVEQELGWTVELLSGAEEATWSFAAACSAAPDLTGACLVVDVGGGSTELITGTNLAAHRPRYPDAITNRASLPLGCVRLTERFFDRQPPAPSSIQAAEHHVRDVLATTDLTGVPASPLIGTAGTASALAQIDLGPDSMPADLHENKAVLSQPRIRRWREHLLRLSVDDIRALHPDAMQGRADVFPVGVLLLDCLLDHIDLDALRISPYELRHGLVLRHLAASSPA